MWWKVAIGVGILWWLSTPSGVAVVGPLWGASCPVGTIPGPYFTCVPALGSAPDPSTGVPVSMAGAPIQVTGACDPTSATFDPVVCNASAGRMTLPPNVAGQPVL